MLAPLFLAASAAASSGDTAGQGDHGQWLTLGFTAVNFALFAYLLRRFASSPLRDFLWGRRKQVVEALAEAAREKAEAEELKKEYLTKAAALGETRARLVEEVRAIAEADGERILEAAEAAGERLMTDAERIAESDIERAKAELRTEAVALAEELASRRIEARLTEEDRRRLLGEFIERVQR
jgi:F-type H+-transporting ATPase subunit b